MIQFFSLLGLLIGLFGGCATADDLISETPESTVKASGTKPLYRMLAYERELETVKSADGERASRLRYDLIPSAARETAFLERGSEYFSANAVYLCDALNRSDWHCEDKRSPYSDDTEQVIRFNKDPISVAVKEPLRIVYDRSQNQLVKIAIAEADQIINKNYKEVKELSSDDGAHIDLERYSKNLQSPVLIAVFKDENGYRKHVWPLKAQ